ncbi:hypothetical protein [Cryptosporangium phraense]|uniref:Uncharacterized protein n=1 Tax=Cryptosporangium phraense TaxID=2593070 RepID=A0A545ASL0_9ACTN|nr:hypothetical protein [Cryptosporangium phraense]TQS44326.1 hypothetical protein FL583_15450 [Cryptosporangium phraense]
MTQILSHNPETVDSAPLCQRWCNTHQHIDYADGGSEGFCRGVHATQHGQFTVVTDLNSGSYIIHPGRPAEVDANDPGYAIVTVTPEGRDSVVHQGPIDELTALAAALTAAVAL